MDNSCVNLKDRKSFAVSSKISVSKRNGEIPSRFKAWIRNSFFSLFVDKLEHMDFHAAAKTFYREIEDKCQFAFKQQRNNEDASITMLSACQVVIFESLSAFESLCLSFHGNIFSHINLITHCCVLLNVQNRSCLEVITAKLNRRVLQVKYHILKEFLKAELTGDTAQLVYLQLLAEELGDSMLIEKVRKALQSQTTKGAKIKMHPNTEKTDCDIVSDGNIYDRATDPPGQRCVYIPPGDTAKESYRLSTFLKFPTNAPVNFHHLAEAGFFYTGYKDRVKCFSCGSSVENWFATDDVWSPHWHRPECLMVQGEDRTNVEIERAVLSRMLPQKQSTQTGSLQPNDVTTFPSCSRASPTPPQTNLSTIPAGVLLMNEISSGESSPMARLNIHSQMEPNRYSNSAFATVPPPFHQNLIRNLDLRKEADRLKSFQNWPMETRTVQPSDLARSGFFYLGSLDRVQCFSCGGILRKWRYGDNVDDEHKRHHPNCRMVSGADGRNVPLSDSERVSAPVPSNPPHFSESEQRNLQEMFPCQYPVNAHMRNEETRFETFDHRWPENRVNATPRQIAKAGFFFLGERDRVKCWYCNGGLQNWDPNDEPWSEHAKWFPACDFLLRNKGPDFVHRITSRFPNLSRPVLRSQYDVPPEQSQNRFQSHQQPPLPPFPIVDSRENVRRAEEELRKVMDSDIVRAAQEMCFETDVIRRVLKRKIRQDGSAFSSLSDLVDALSAEAEASDSDESENESVALTNTTTSLPGPSHISEPNISTNPQPTTTDTKTTSATASSSQAATSGSEGLSPSMLKKLENLQEERKCKICLDNDADIVFVPCGHLCCCKSCAEAVTRCPICRSKITQGIRTYIS